MYVIICTADVYSHSVRVRGQVVLATNVPNKILQLINLINTGIGLEKYTVCVGGRERRLLIVQNGLQENDPP
jgi:hypothetical protein